MRSIPAHAGNALAHDDPFWDVYFPPNGWGCECYIAGISAARLKQLGKERPDKAPAIKMADVSIGTRSATPRTVKVAEGVDPGFSYALGRDAWLRQQASHAIATADAQSAATWEPVLQTTARDLDLPPLPISRTQIELGRRLSDADAVSQSLAELIGRNTRVFDVYGLPIIVDAASLGRHIDPTRSTYLPLLIDALTRPSEVWISLERESQTGAYRVRSRMLKRYALDTDRVLLVVADEQDSAMVAWTVVPTSDLNYVNRQRQGMLWWREQQ